MVRKERSAQWTRSSPSRDEDAELLLQGSESCGVTVNSAVSGSRGVLPATALLSCAHPHNTGCTPHLTALPMSHTALPNSLIAAQATTRPQHTPGVGLCPYKTSCIQDVPSTLQEQVRMSSGVLSPMLHIERTEFLPSITAQQLVT